MCQAAQLNRGPRSEPAQLAVSRAIADTRARPCAQLDFVPFHRISVSGCKSLNYATAALILIAAVGALVALRRMRGSDALRIDTGAVSEQWLAESRREEEA